MADPDVAVGEPLRLPDRRPGLGLVDRVARGVEGRVAMRGDGHDRDRGLAERHLAGPMDDGQAGDPEARRDLVGDRLERVEGHRLVRLVLERLHAPAGVARGLGLLPGRRRARGRPGPAEEADDRAVARIGQSVGQLGQDPGVERVLAQLEHPRRRSRPRPAGSSRPRRRRPVRSVASA